MKRYKLTGVLLILLGVLLFLGLTAYQLFHCIDMWHHESKTLSFDSFSDYYFSVSGGALLISLTSGIVLVCEGIFLCRRDAQ